LYMYAKQEDREQGPVSIHVMSELLDVCEEIMKCICCI